MDVLLDDLGDPKFAEVLARGPDRLGGGFFPRSAAGPDDLDHAVHAHDVSFSGLPGPTAAVTAAGAVSRIVVIVRAPCSGVLISACTCGSAGPDAPDPPSGDVRPVITTASRPGAAAASSWGPVPARASRGDARRRLL